MRIAVTMTKKRTNLLPRRPRKRLNLMTKRKMTRRTRPNQIK